MHLRFYYHARVFIQIFLFVLLVCILSGCSDHQKISPPRAQEGVLDLSSWDFKKEGTISLSGEWQFYWRQLLTPEDFVSSNHPESTGYSRLPGSWNNQIIDGRLLSGDGFATYRLQALVPQDENVKAVRIKNQSSAYVLYINGKIVAQNGVVGKNREAVVPQYRLEQNTFYDNTGTLDVIIQVANFNHRKGGIWNPIQLGDAETLQASQNLQWIFDLILLGCLLIMGTYYLSLYLLFTKDKSPLYLAIFTLFFAIRIMVTGNYYITQIIPVVPWEMAYKLELSTIIVGPAGLLLFVTSIFKRKKRDWIQLLLLLLMVILGIITLFWPARISSHIVPHCQKVILLIFGYSLYILIRELIRGDKKAGVLLWGMIIVTATIIIDILSANKIIYLSYLAHFGILFLIFSQSFVLSMRFSDTFKEVRQLSRELGKKNITLQRMDKLKDEFLANTAHELRTPLNGIVGMAESLHTEIGSKVTEAATEKIATIVASGRRLGKLINDVLDFSRLKNKDINLNCRTIDLRTLTNVVLSVLRPLADKKSLTLLNQVDTNTPTLYADEDRLQQILYNLVGNGIKFTDLGSITVSSVARDGLVEVTVSDTGVGIAPDRLEAIFAPYEQGHLEQEKGYGGTGLGLAIASRLVALHGGSISVESNPGEGSNFTFSISVSTEEKVGVDTQALTPAEKGDLRPPVDISPPLSYGVQDTLTAKSVLVVDDDPVNLQVVASHLQAASLVFATAADGPKALSLIEKSGAPALVLLDIMMPKMDGYEVCRKLREQFSPAELPIIMLTARSGLENLVRGFEAGGNDYITKPFSKDELISRVRTHLQLREAYHVLKENVQLKNEIERRKRTELDLRLMQQRLSRILDSFDDAIIAVNECHEVSFSNAQCATMLGHDPVNLLGRPVMDLFPADKKQESMTLLEEILQEPSHELPHEQQPFTLLQKDGHILACRILFTHLDIDQEQLLVLILQSQPKSTDSEKDHLDQPSTLTLIEGLNHTRQKLQAMENSLNLLPPIETAKNFQADVNMLRKTIGHLERTLVGPSNDMERKRRAVEAMNLALAYWQKSTGLTKSDLAERSGIWKVYVNHNGFERTQTLDKYLDISRLPNHPRWQKILETIDFVLLAGDTASAERGKLEEFALQLKFSN